MDVCIYFQVHQPMRLKRVYSIYKIRDPYEDYFDHELNQKILKKVAEKCYFPTNSLLLNLADKYDFKFSFSITGVFLEQCKRYYPEVLDSFIELAKHKNVSILSETYYHSLASLFPSKLEFIQQVREHKEILAKYGITTTSAFRNTELILSNEIASAVESMEHTVILGEGIENLLGWRSPNYLYHVNKTKHIKALLRNYRLSDDIGYRFSAKWWSEYPLTAEKYAAWLAATSGNTINLFMDYETFGEHHWKDTGIFEFLKKLPEEVLKYNYLEFNHPHKIAEKHNAYDTIDAYYPISWADMERDVSAWLGNDMQRECFKAVQEIETEVRDTYDKYLLHIWRLLQTSDHLYYLSTKSLSDQDVHNYFSHYDSPFEAFINYMNIINHFKGLLNGKK
ncbi:MAG: glycoside hydrolase family 57 protein [Candidatus Anstonellales archaeon]